MQSEMTESVDKSTVISWVVWLIRAMTKARRGGGVRVLEFWVERNVRRVGLWGSSKAYVVKRDVEVKGIGDVLGCD